MVFSQPTNLEQQIKLEWLYGIFFSQKKNDDGVEVNVIVIIDFILQILLNWFPLYHLFRLWHQVQWQGSAIFFPMRRQQNFLQITLLINFVVVVTRLHFMVMIHGLRCFPAISKGLTERLRFLYPTSQRWWQLFFQLC